MLRGAKSLVKQSLPRPARRWLAAREFQIGIVSGDPELRHLHRFVHAGDTVVDAGCNAGVYSYALSRLGANVIAFEPNPVVAGRLKGLSFPRVEVRNLALSDTAGSTVLHIPKVQYGAALATLNAAMFDKTTVERIDVKAVRLDDEIDQDRPVSFIKIDVEGYEEFVLSGGRVVLARDKPTLLIEIEERHNPGGLGRIESLLGELDYTGYYWNDGWQPVAGFDAASLQNADFSASRDARYINNFLFVPHQTAVELS